MSKLTKKEQKLTAATVGKAQAIIEEMAAQLESPIVDIMMRTRNNKDRWVIETYDGEWGAGDTLYEAYVKALHTPAGTELPPF